MDRTSESTSEAKMTVLVADIAFIIYLGVFLACLFVAVAGDSLFLAIVFGGAAFSFGLGLLFLAGLRHDMVEYLRREKAALAGR